MPPVRRLAKRRQRIAAALPSDCQICCEVAKRDVVICEACEYVACNPCAVRALLTPGSVDACVNCLQAYGHADIVRTFGKPFFRLEYARKRGDALFADEEAIAAITAANPDYLFECPSPTCDGHVVEASSAEIGTGSRLILTGDDPRDPLGRTIPVVACNKCAIRACPDCHVALPTSNNGVVGTVGAAGTPGAQWIGRQASAAKPIRPPVTATIGFAAGVLRGRKDPSDAVDAAPIDQQSTRATIRLQSDEHARSAAAKSLSSSSVAATPPPQPHRCSARDLATVALMETDTQACPACRARIYKEAEGCDQMHCTRCKTTFDWSTGVVHDVGALVHNPHYAQRVRAAGLLTRSTMDAMNRVPNLDLVPTPLLTERIISTHYLMTVICERYLPLYENRDVGNNRDLRARYATGELSDARYRAELVAREMRAYKNKLVHDALSSLVITMALAFDELVNYAIELLRPRLLSTVEGSAAVVAQLLPLSVLTVADGLAINARVATFIRDVREPATRVALAKLDECRLLYDCGVPYIYADLLGNPYIQMRGHSSRPIYLPTKAAADLLQQRVRAVTRERRRAYAILRTGMTADYARWRVNVLEEP
jgi:hypothetical protein